MERVRQQDTTADLVLRKKEQKDVDLDKKIKALRKKNEALVKRYKEIEEDKKRAEHEGIAVTSRKPKQDELTITVTKEKRVVSEKRGSGCPPCPAAEVHTREEEDEEVDHKFTFGRGKRIQLAITMDSRVKGERVVSEKHGSGCPITPSGVMELTDEDVDHLFTFGRGKRMQIAITMDSKTKAEEGRRMIEKHLKESGKKIDCGPSHKGGFQHFHRGPLNPSEMMTEQERIEYIRWKKEREQIDRERLARHKNAEGEWRRAWDAEKTEHMFEKGATASSEAEVSSSSRRGGRNLRKLNTRLRHSEGRGGGQQTAQPVDGTSKGVPTVSSRARGRDRLTGRAKSLEEKKENSQEPGKDLLQSTLSKDTSDHQTKERQDTTR